jgi:CubicO group peptidase (beta-lactamase class C family)
MRRQCARHLLVGFAALWAASAIAQERQPDAQTRAVETGLTPVVIAKGHVPARWSIVERMKAYHVPGASVAVVHGYRIDWAKGYGVRDQGTGEPVTAETLFQAGSISKPVAAAAALRLVEQKRLLLDRDVNLDLRSWKVPENEFTTSEKVTLRRLLSHSAGLTVHGFPGYASGAPVPRLVDVLDGKSPANTPAVRVDATPGSIWRYSGGGYTVMQLLLADVTGETFPELMERLVLRQAGMKQSTYEQPLPEKARPLAATGYNAAGAPIPGKYHTYPEMAAAGLWTTPSDLARFGIEIQKSREGRSTLIEKESAVEMLRVQKGTWGLGFELLPDPQTPRFLHGGADEGFRAQFIFDANGDGAVVMTNSDNGSDLAREIIQSIAAAYGWRNMAPKERETVRLETAALESFAGRYQSPQLGIATMRVQNDHLVISSAVFSDMDFYPASSKVFFPLAGGLPEITFVRDERGNVVGAAAGPIQATKIQSAK